jgi:predicted acyltransferase
LSSGQGHLDAELGFFSGGLCCLFLAAFYALVDICGMQWLVFPLIVIGANSIGAYSMSHIFPVFAFHSLDRVFGKGIFGVFGDVYESTVYGAAVLLVYWLILFVFYWRKIFLRI